MSYTLIIAQTVAENPEHTKAALYGLQPQSSAERRQSFGVPPSGGQPAVFVQTA
jgi:hypothetical protein